MSAVAGTLAVAATLLALRPYGRWPAVAGAAWTAGALWLVCISRDGMRNILVPLVAALAVAALLSWVARPARLPAGTAGAAVAAGLWTYQPLKLLPLLAGLWLLGIRRRDKELFSRLWATRWWFAGVLAAVAAPMLWVAVTDPVLYLGRAAGVSPFNPQVGPAGLPEHVVRTLGMLTVAGDPNGRHDVDGLPLLGPPPLAWPLLALAVLGARHAWRRRADPRFSLLLIAVPLFLVPPLVALEGGTPHFLRSLALAPFLAALIGVGCVEATDLLRRAASRLQRPALARAAPAAIAAVAGALLAATALTSASAYFSRPARDRYEPYTYDLVALAGASRGGPGTAVVVDDFAALDVRFLDAGALPAIVDPGRRVDLPWRFSRLVARSRRELAAAVGPSPAARATAVARDPQGRPVVWTVTP